MDYSRTIRLAVLALFSSKITLPFAGASIERLLLSCVAGKYGTISCVACPTGTYSAASGSTACEICPAGSYSVALASSCSSCSAGFYQVSISASSCTSCPAGSYCSGAGQSVISGTCSAGTYSVASATFCSSCSPATYQASIGSISCQACAAGSYSASQRASTCTACSSGFYTAGQTWSGSSGCTAVSSTALCGPGKYAPLIPKCGSNTFCEMVVNNAAFCFGLSTGCRWPALYWGGCQSDSDCSNYDLSSAKYSDPSFCYGTQTLTGWPLDTCAKGCLPCPAGTFSVAVTTVTACTSCSTGFYATSTGATLCTSCPAGSYCPTLGSTAPYSNCAAGSYSVASASACSNCAAGYYQANTGATSCESCPAGSYCSGSGLTLITGSCTAGAYSSVSATACTQCSTGLYSTSASASLCSSCSSGHYQVATGALSLLSCAACASGTYSLAAASYCTGCLAGSFQPVTGASGCLSCTSGQLNQFYGATACLSCAPGMFEPSSGSSSCSSCPPGQYSATSTSCTSCTAGSFAPAPSYSACLKCGVGMHQSLSGSYNCTQCPAGQYSPFEGAVLSTTCTQCSQGSFQASTGASCLACPTGMYAAVFGAISCASCTVGFYQPSSGQYGCFACSAGTIQVNLGATSSSDCISCPPGTYQPLSGSSSCSSCPPGSFQASVGSVSCDLCTPGKFGVSAASSSCTMCGVMTASSAIGSPLSSTCQTCPTGYLTSSDHATCQQCASGQYVNTNLSICVNCQSGRFAPQPQNTQCISCSNGSFSSRDDSDTSTKDLLSACTVCSPGHFAPATASTSCTACSSGQAQGATTQNTCLPCAEGWYSGAAAAAACSPCSPGAYSPTSMSSACLHCQPGYYSIAAASGCSFCLAGFYQASPGAIACSACEPGTFSAFSGLSSCDTCLSGAYSSLTASGCNFCAVGSYSAASGRASCTTCGAGTIAALPGSIACAPCLRGQFQSAFGQIACLGCEPGKYVAETGAAGCSTCSQGQYMPFQGGTTCASCSVGYFSTGGSSTCSACGFGMYAPSSERSNCLDCGAGFFNPQSASSSCGPCATGYYQPSSGQDSCFSCLGGSLTAERGAQRCEACSSGQYATASGSSSCAPCNAGSYSGVGASYCTMCSSGFYTPTSGNPACAACESGRFIASTGSQICTDCLPGHFSASSGSGLCVACSSKTYAPTSGRSSCLDCTAGYFNLNIGVSACVECIPGFYSFESASACVECIPGMFVRDSGRSTCTQCGVGKFSSTNAATRCPRCTPGNYQGSIGQTVCIECPAGTKAEKPGLSSCKNCDQMYWSHPGQRNCSVANVGFYLDPVTRKSKPCPHGSTCLGFEYLPQPQKAYWVQRGVDSHVGSVYPCPRGTCKGADVDDRHLLECWTTPSARRQNCSDAATLLCLTGSSGPLCGYCAPNFVYSSALRVCQPCEQASVFSVIIAGSIMSIAAFALGLYTGKLSIPTRVSDSWTLGMLRKIDSGAFRVSWATYQIVQSVTWNLDVVYPDPFNSLLSLLSVFSFDFFSSACMFPQSSNLLSEVYLWSALPLVLSGCILMSHFIQSLRLGANLDGLRSQHTYYILLMSYLTLPSVSLKQFQALDCVAIAGRHYLRVDTSVDCASPQYQTFRAVNILFVCFYMSVPLSWLVLLFRLRERLNPSTTSADAGLVLWMRDRDPTLAPVRFLFVAYQPRYYYWEALELYRRVAFIGVLPLLSAKPDRRAAIGVLLSIVSLAVYGEVGPLQRDSNKILARVAQYTIFMTFGSALAIQSQLSKNANNLALGGSLLFINLVVIFLVFAMAGYRHHLEKKSRTAQLERQALKIEWAAHFDANKFGTTFEAVERAFIPPSHALVFHYTSLARAQEMIDSGIPCSKHYRGVVFSLHSPKELDIQDDQAFCSQEVVLACSVPRTFLSPLHKGLEFCALRVMSSAVLTAVRGGDFGSLRNPDPWYEGQVLLPPRCIVRAYRLVEEEISSDKAGQEHDANSAHVYDDNFNTDARVKMETPSTCEEYLGRMAIIREECARRGWKPLYHYTQPGLGALIQSTGFRMSTQGQGDGGVYFSTLGPTSYALGSSDYERNIIIDCFGAGRLEEYKGKHKLDLCIVYGAEPWALSPSPGGRDNALMVSKATFEALALPSVDGNYFLRKDRILGMFLLDPAFPPSGYKESVGSLERESRLDLETKAALFGIVAEMNHNEMSVGRFASLKKDEQTAHAEAESAAASQVAAAASANTWLVGVGKRLSRRFSALGEGGGYAGEFGHFEGPTQERARHVAFNPMANSMAARSGYADDRTVAEAAEVAETALPQAAQAEHRESRFLRTFFGSLTDGAGGGSGDLRALSGAPSVHVTGASASASASASEHFKAANMPQLFMKRKFAMGQQLSGLVKGKQVQQAQQDRGQLRYNADEERLSGRGDSIVDF